MTERYGVAVFAFVAAATWLGVGVIHGLMCLLVAFLAAQAMRLHQRRTDARARASSRRERPVRRRPAAERPATDRPAQRGLYDGDREAFDWPTASDGAW